jgi:putative ABC transport system permease protein
MDSLGTMLQQDLRYGIRRLRKDPGFSIVGLLLLGLGIAINTAVFSIINTLLFRPPPAAAPHELMYIHAGNPDIAGISYSDYLYLREHNSVFTDILAVCGYKARLGYNGGTESVYGEIVSSNYFDLLGVRAILGRTFSHEQDRSGNMQPVVILSNSLWQRLFHADPRVLGRQIELDGQSVTVIGVVAMQFKGMLNAWRACQFWVPFSQYLSESEDAKGHKRTADNIPILAIGRLRPGIGAEQAKAVVATLSKQLQQAYHPRNPDYGIVAAGSRRTSLPFNPVRSVIPERFLAALMGVAGIVLIIASSNIAGIMMARGLAVERQVAVRLAVGATRVRILREHLSEAILLSAMGGLLGLVMARFLVEVFLASIPIYFQGFQISVDVPIDARVFVFSTFVCIVAGLVAGLGPALQAASTNVAAALVGTGQIGSRRMKRAVRFLVTVPQVGLSLTLLLLAGALTRALLKTELTDPGYDAKGLVLIDFELPLHDERVRSREQREGFMEKRRLSYRRILERAGEIHGLAGISLVDGLPTRPLRARVIAREEFLKDSQPVQVSMAVITPRYFHTMGIKVIQGRALEERDSIDNPRVAIICEALAKRLWPGANPVGKYVGFHIAESQRIPEWLEVVGVVNEVKPPLSDGTPNPYIYVPFEQQRYLPAATIVARSYGNSARVIQELRESVIRADPGAFITQSRTMLEAIGEIRYPQRLSAALVALSASIGLFLTAVGTYGIVSYSVAQRVKEIGIRVALGARRIDIMKLAISQGIKLMVIGGALGFLLTLAAMRIASHLMVTMPDLDPIALAVVLIVQAAVIFLSCFLPARRAAWMDPMVVLRGL